jgi:hypothetical protein
LLSNNVRKSRKVSKSRYVSNSRDGNNSRDATTIGPPGTAGKPGTLETPIAGETSTAVGTAAIADCSHSRDSKNVNSGKNINKSKMKTTQIQPEHQGGTPTTAGMSEPVETSVAEGMLACKAPASAGSQNIRDHIHNNSWDSRFADGSQNVGNSRGNRNTKGPQQCQQGF